MKRARHSISETGIRKDASAEAIGADRALVILLIICAIVVGIAGLF